MLQALAYLLVFGVLDGLGCLASVAALAVLGTAYQVPLPLLLCVSPGVLWTAAWAGWRLSESSAALSLAARLGLALGADADAAELDFELDSELDLLPTLAATASPGLGWRLWALPRLDGVSLMPAAGETVAAL